MGLCAPRKRASGVHTRGAGAVTGTASRPLAPRRLRSVREFAESADWILEPSWEGTRALAVVGPSERSFIGYGGEAVDAPRELLDAIAAVAECESAVLDGVIVHTFADESELEPGASSGEAFQRAASPRQVYVAVDLLEVDGTSLVDAPLLERKRHLAGLLRPSTNVRVSPYVRSGMRAWRDTLTGQGFKRFVVKRINSRYPAGDGKDDWLQVEKL